MTDHKNYLDEQYRLAALDYRTAHTDEEQWNARKRMAQTERTASELTGMNLRITCIRNMSILYWINDFFARIHFTYFCVDSPSIYERNRKKSLKKLK